MPRDINDIYTLPAGNPVIPGTVIETNWANTTLNDIAQALTDSLDKSDPAQARNVLGLGSAATKDAQTSTTNTTTGRLLLMGAFGLGTVGIATTNLDTISVSGMYKVGSSGIGIPPISTALGYNVTYQGDANFGTMIAYGYDSAKMFVRRRQSGTWGAWLEILIAGDYGIGGFAVDASGSGFDCDSLLVNGIYSISPTTLNGPGHGGALFCMSRALLSYNQFVVGLNSISFRTFASVWQPWRKVFFDAGNNLISDDTGSIGFGTGSGGTVTQATSKTTPVTLNKPSGRVTMNNAALAAGASVSFRLNNSLIASTDLVLLNAVTTANNYRVEVAGVSAGLCNVRVTNISAGSLSDALVINFSVIKGAIA